MVKLSKIRRKELRKEYEKTRGEKYVTELEKLPTMSWFEWVELKIRYLE